MSWLSEALSGDTDVKITPPTPEQAANYYRIAKQNNPTYYEQYLKNTPGGQALEAELAAAAAAPTLTAEAAAPTPAAPTYSGPTAEAKLQGLLPTGFENTLVPGSVAGPLISSTASSGRAKAQEFIQNMLSRGTLGESGGASALQKLNAQDAGVTNKLTGISDTLLANERAKLRGIANEGYGAAAGQSGEGFDPTPYKTRTDTEASQFLQDFPGAFSSGVGDVGTLYDTTGLAGAGGGVTNSANVSYDPYAVEGGKLSSGTGANEQRPPAPKKRSTAVF